LTAALHDRSTIFLEYLMPLISNFQTQALLRPQHDIIAPPAPDCLLLSPYCLLYRLSLDLSLNLNLTLWVNRTTAALSMETQYEQNV